MDSFDDQNFGHILRDLTSTDESKEFSHLPVPLEAVDDIDVPDHKILTPLEIPKSQTQLNFCKSLTEKLKSETEYPLTQVEPIEIVKNEYPETGDDRYLIPDSTTPAISSEIPKMTQETAASEEPARPEILVCLNDITPPPSADSSSNFNSEITTPSPGMKLEDTLNLPEAETEVTRPRFFQQKSNLSSSAVAAKRKADDASICSRPAKQQTCLYHPGMIVWAKITGYSYWPAMIDHDPDVNAYTWPNDSTSDFTHYHVVFFDTNGRLSRSWVKTHYLKLFTEVVKISSSRPRDYIERFKRSVKEAKEAMNLSVEERLRRYSFTERLKLPGTKLCQD